MTCNECQSLLLQSDDIDAPDGVFERAELHAAGCAECSDLVRKLRRLNDAVRSLPEPDGLLESRLRFESQFAHKLRPTRRRHLPRFATAAAVAFLALGAGTFAYVHHLNQSRLVASSETIDQAVDFNLSLGESESDDERNKLFAQGNQTFHDKADTTSLSDDDRQFADNLIQGAKFLTDHRDPLAQADHFTGVAEMLITRMDKARKNPKAVGRLSQAYLNVMNKGVHRNLDLATADSQSPENQRRLEKIIQRNLSLYNKLEATLRDHPDQPQLRKQLEQVQHRLHRLQVKAATTQPGTPTSLKRGPIR
jgi:hypothetical protein